MVTLEIGPTSDSPRNWNWCYAYLYSSTLQRVYKLVLRKPESVFGSIEHELHASTPHEFLTDNIFFIANLKKFRGIFISKIIINLFRSTSISLWRGTVKFTERFRWSEGINEFVVNKNLTLEPNEKDTPSLWGTSLGGRRRQGRVRKGKMERGKRERAWGEKRTPDTRPPLFISSSRHAFLLHLPPQSLPSPSLRLPRRLMRSNEVPKKTGSSKIKLEREKRHKSQMKKIKIK